MSPAPGVSISKVPPVCTIEPLLAIPRSPRTLTMPPVTISWPAPVTLLPAANVRMPSFRLRLRPAAMSYRPVSTPPVCKIIPPGPFTFTVPVLLNAVIDRPIALSLGVAQFSVPALVKVPVPEMLRMAFKSLVLMLSTPPTALVKVLPSTSKRPVVKFNVP